MKKYIANIITSCRIIFSILMLFFPVFSAWFYVMYITGGFTDMIDGTIARKTNSVSKFGSHLDTLADFVFTSAALFKILPVIDIPHWILKWIFIITIIKIINIISGFIYEKRFMAEHTIMNRITGILLFLLPLTFLFIDLKYSTVTVCSIATFAAIQEGYYIKKGIEI